MVELSKTSKFILSHMNHHEIYSASGIGYIAFGERKPNGRYRSPQGSALAAGRFIREMVNANLIYSVSGRHGYKKKYV